jgi:hypothetical protein
MTEPSPEPLCNTLFECKLSRSIIAIDCREQKGARMLIQRVYGPFDGGAGHRKTP